MIRRDDIGFEDLDPICRSDVRKLAQQDGAEPASLKVVRYSESNLGALFVDAT